VRFFQNLIYSFSLRNSKFFFFFFLIVQRGRLFASHNIHLIRFVRSVYNSLVHCFRISYEPNWTIRIVCIYAGKETGGEERSRVIISISIKYESFYECCCCCCCFLNDSQNIQYNFMVSMTMTMIVIVTVTITITITITINLLAEFGAIRIMLMVAPR
jgi:hypothetical protein